jgi:hypothetical protein
MNLPWGKIGGTALRIALGVVMGVPKVEALNAPGSPLTGEQKKAAVLDLIQTELTLAEQVAGRDLASDADVLKAAGGVIDAVSALHNVLAAKAHGAGV